MVGLYLDRDSYDAFQADNVEAKARGAFQDTLKANQLEDQARQSFYGAVAAGGLEFRARDAAYAASASPPARDDWRLDRTPASQDTGSSYTVQPGDTLSSIAKQRLGDADQYSDVAAANQISDPNRITPGQRIRIDRNPPTGEDIRDERST